MKYRRRYLNIYLICRRRRRRRAYILDGIVIFRSWLLFIISDVPTTTGKKTHNTRNNYTPVMFVTTYTRIGSCVCVCVGILLFLKIRPKRFPFSFLPKPFKRAIIGETRRDHSPRRAAANFSYVNRR